MAYKYYWKSMGAWIWGSIWVIGVLVVVVFYLLPWLDEIGFHDTRNMFMPPSETVDEDSGTPL